MEETTEKQETKPKYPENTLLRVDYTVEGPVETRWVQEKEVKLPPTSALEFALHRKLQPKHYAAFSTLLKMIEAIKKQNREIPLLQSEILQVVEKGTLKALEKFNLIKSKSIQFMDSKGSKMGGRCILWLTPEGKFLAATLKEKPVVEAVPVTTDL